MSGWTRLNRPCDLTIFTTNVLNIVTGYYETTLCCCIGYQEIAENIITIDKQTSPFDPLLAIDNKKGINSRV